MSKSRVATEEQLTWYETTLPLLERKKRGHFSTPPRLVANILDACGYTPDNDLASVRVLDPACGSGNFLVEAARRLQAFSIQAGLSSKEKAGLFKRNLWGIDPDPVSCFLAEMHVQSLMHSRSVRPTPFIPLHIHQADSLVLPWEAGVDLFVANPPYLAAKNNDLSGYQSVHQRGQADSYLLFLNLALQVVRPGGWIGLVLPDPLVARSNAARERERLLKETTIYHLWHFSEVFAAEVGAVVIVARKTSPQRLHSISWERGHWHPKLSPDSHDHVQQSLFARQPGAEFRYLLSQGQGDAIERLRTSLEDTPTIDRHLAPLGEFLTISRGEELGKESYYLQESPLRFHSDTSFVSKRLENVLDIDSPDSLTATLPVLRGGIDIHSYMQPVASHFIVRDAIHKPLERYKSPKLLVVKSTDRLQATLDLQGNVALQTLYLLHLRDQHASVDQLYFYMALLNSQLLREYVYVLHTAYKMVQPQIEQRVLSSLPVPLVRPEARQAIIERSRVLVHACSGTDPVVEWNEQITALYEEQERDICALYDSVLAGALLTKES